MCQPTNNQYDSRSDSLHLLQEASEVASAARVAFAMAAVAASPPPTAQVSRWQTRNLPGLPHYRVAHLTERGAFLLFIKCLLKYLEKAKEQALRSHCVAIVSLCVQRNRTGDPEFTPLPDVIELLLRKCIGPVHYARAKLCADMLCEK